MPGLGRHAPRQRSAAALGGVVERQGGGHGAVEGDEVDGVSRQGRGGAQAPW